MASLALLEHQTFPESDKIAVKTVMNDTASLWPVMISAKKVIHTEPRVNIKTVFSYVMIPII